jgi:hypothetical protein
MPRSSEDLAALITAGDDYRETVMIDYLGQEFAVIIRPLTEYELTDANRQMKFSAALIKKMQSKIKVGKKLTAEEQKVATEEAIEAVLSEGTIDVGDISFTNFILARELCKRGIVDEKLVSLVPKFRYGLTEKIANRIQTISDVPPAVVENFFGQVPGNP